MNYAADGPLDPPFIEEINEHKLADILGYKIIVTEWADYTYTVNVYRLDEYGVEETLEDGETVYESFPEEEDIRALIVEALEP